MEHNSLDLKYANNEDLWNNDSLTQIHNILRKEIETTTLPHTARKFLELLAKQTPSKIFCRYTITAKNHMAASNWCNLINKLELINWSFNDSNFISELFHVSPSAPIAVTKNIDLSKNPKNQDILINLYKLHAKCVATESRSSIFLRESIQNLERSGILLPIDNHHIEVFTTLDPKSNVHHEGRNSAIELCDQLILTNHIFTISDLNELPFIASEKHLLEFSNNLQMRWATKLSKLDTSNKEAVDDAIRTNNQILELCGNISKPHDYILNFQELSKQKAA
ncbi:hypothetical protein [Vibrio barjaei]|uniref:hypothetical protein n=1 Tax=Vibrio barjaei TaxID=1676683 RepID=UPI0022851B9E|nr:hypothetical protein [Vibrio barjaei]MCY9874075.1 hypothetical protein [Vibrio barjaei]